MDLIEILKSISGPVIGGVVGFFSGRLTRENLKQQNKSLEYERLSDAFDKLNEAFNQLEKQRDNDREEIKLLHDENRANRAENTALREQITKLWEAQNNERHSCKEQIKLLEIEVGELREKVRVLTDRNKQLESELEAKKVIKPANGGSGGR